MIQSFKCADTQALFETGRNRRFHAISPVATRKLAQ
jgi:proteic killer suppression protein